MFVPFFAIVFDRVRILSWSDKRERSQAGDHVDLVGDFRGDCKAANLTDHAIVGLANVFKCEQASAQHLFDQVNRGTHFQRIAVRVDLDIS